MVQDKLQQLESEKAEIKKAMVDSQSIADLSTIRKQLDEFLSFKTLTIEMVLRFIERIEVDNNQNVKIYYKFAPIERVKV
jgi:site-specific DNA recombinase